ncbi:uncharacterized protein ACHE_70338S [Aspergillus chevalieri]|uniref:Uncharacterized protein n=1 Tax=Aspergillus chevalieri TaxID=182096 RepID=A0A7R7VVP7_ASPCH|nr:uncharacterized protein ACHE_70338S [Aspergillus chevalieri]BCR91495.1 hypothetical protein ACHE_70338S [Aspergillus chevalieri]
MASRRFILLSSPFAIGYGVHQGLNILEAKYPALPPDTNTSAALRTPSNPKTQRCAYVDVYSARVPVKALESHPAAEESRNLQEAWARTLFQSRVLRTEARLIGLFTAGRPTPGDTGNTPGGFSQKDERGEQRKLMNGALAVERSPSSGSWLSMSGPSGLLVSWKVPDNAREFFEKISVYGYPWRLMSGGRHEVSVSKPFKEEGRQVVEVRFASAHDYEIVPDEGELEKQKVIPAWVGKLHRGFARLILDSAVRELQD